MINYIAYIVIIIIYVFVFIVAIKAINRGMKAKQKLNKDKHYDKYKNKKNF